MTPDTPSVGLFGSVKSLAANLVAHLHSRLELFAIELTQEKLRLTSLLAMAVSALFFLFMAVVLAVLFIVGAFWDTPYRLHVMALLAVLFVGAAGIALGMVIAKLKSGPRLFEVTLAELYKDRKQLNTP